MGKAFKREAESESRSTKVYFWCVRRRKTHTRAPAFDANDLDCCVALRTRLLKEALGPDAPSSSAFVQRPRALLVLRCFLFLLSRSCRPK